MQLSDLADVCLDAAWKVAEEETRRRYGLAAAPGQFAVVGLGKLGARARVSVGALARGVGAGISAARASGAADSGSMLERIAVWVRAVSLHASTGGAPRALPSRSGTPHGVVSTAVSIAM